MKEWRQDTEGHRTKKAKRSTNRNRNKRSESRRSNEPLVSELEEEGEKLEEESVGNKQTRKKERKKCQE
jgi:hypothetical protein